MIYTRLLPLMEECTIVCLLAAFSNQRTDRGYTGSNKEVKILWFKYWIIKYLT